MSRYSFIVLGQGELLRLQMEEVKQQLVDLQQKYQTMLTVITALTSTPLTVRGFGWKVEVMRVISVSNINELFLLYAGSAVSFVCDL